MRVLADLSLMPSICSGTCIRRDLHKKDDVLSKMNKLGMWGKPLEIILSDIFRREIGCKRVSGLTDLQIHAQFVTNLKKKLRSGFLYTHSQSALLFTFLSIG